MGENGRESKRVGGSGREGKRVGGIGRHAQRANERVEESGRMWGVTKIMDSR